MRTSGFKDELERRRRLAVCHVLAGYRQCTVAMFLGVHPSSVSRWMKAFRRGGDGALEGHDPAGRPRKLSAARETPGADLVSSLAHVFRLSNRTVDRREGRSSHLSQVANQVSSTLSQSMACRTACFAAEAAIPSTRARRSRSATLASRGLAANKKTRRGGVRTSF